MKLSREIVLEYMQEQAKKDPKGVRFTTQELSAVFGMQRSNLSKLLNELVKENRIKKTSGRPVYYFPVKKGEESCFRKLIGAAESLKSAIQLTKAALLYPGGALPLLLTGPDGSGKSMLASLVYEFAKEQGILRQDAPFVKINCRYLEEESEEKRKEVFFSETEGAFHKARNGVLFIDHVNCLGHDVQNELLRQAEIFQTSLSDMVLIYSVDDATTSSQLSLYTSKFSIVVDLPPLSARTLLERFEMIQQFFQKEAMRMKREIKINAELLRALLLYPCQFHVKQLKKDIKLGCANGYARNFDRKLEQIEVTMHDFPDYVRRGLLSYRKYRTQIEAILPDNYSYIFRADAIDAFREPESAESAEKNPRDTLYEIIDRKVEELKEYGVEEDDISAILHENLDQIFYKIDQSMGKKEIDKESLSKIVDSKLIELVEQFLGEASEQFERVYPDAAFYAICLHLSSMSGRQLKAQKMTDEQIAKVVKECNKEYIFCSKFAGELKETLGLRLPVDEIVFLTMFICQEHYESALENRPVVLVAMHGNTTASSIVKVVNDLVGDDNIYAFDLVLDRDMQQVYEALKQTVIDIDQGKGVLMLYDMGSLQTMAGMIGAETGIEIKSICVPATLIALDCSRKASSYHSLDEVYREVMESYQQVYQELEQSSRNRGNPQVIITLCMTGEGAAVQMKNYISAHIHLENTDVVPLAISDRDYLLKKVNQIQKKQKIVCVVGAYDPKLYGIPYIPISTLFDTPSDKLDILLSLETTQAVAAVNYNAIYAYLAEQLEGFDIQLLKEVLPPVLGKVKKAARGLSSDQEIGLFMHIACLIYRIQNQEPSPQNRQAQYIISKNKRLYNDLKDILTRLEGEFYISINDDELANIIQIIKRC